MHGQRADCVVQICIAPTTLRSGPRRPVDRAFSRAHRQRSITRVLGGLLQNRRALLGAHPGRDVDLEPSSRCRAAGAGHRQPGPDRSRADRSRTARGAQCQRPAGRHESRRLVFRVRQAVGTALVSGAPRLAAYIRRSASAMTASAVSAGDGAAIPIEAEATPMPSTSNEILPPRRPARRSTDAAWTMAASVVPAAYLSVATPPPNVRERYGGPCNTGYIDVGRATQPVPSREDRARHPRIQAPAGSTSLAGGSRRELEREGVP